MNSNKELGSQGENFVCNCLKRKGYRIVETNYTNRVGELDIVAYDGEELCFIEVKTRLDESYGDPLEAVTYSKQRKLLKMAQLYIQDRDLYDVYARFDVVAVLGDPEAGAQIEIIKNAFELAY